jgi:EPS-associated MarR family transcriptional regulator
MNAQEINYNLLKILNRDADLTQREIAKRMGVSLGKANYCISEFAKKGLIKTQRFNESKTKFRYLYILTPKGIEERARLTVSFLKRKIAEHEEIKKLIKELSREIEESSLADIDDVLPVEALEQIL